MRRPNKRNRRELTKTLTNSGGRNRLVLINREFFQDEGSAGVGAIT